MNFFDLLENMAKNLVADALIQTKGNKEQAAKALGVARTTVIYRIRRHNLGQLVSNLCLERNIVIPVAPPVIVQKRGVKPGSVRKLNSLKPEDASLG